MKVNAVRSSDNKSKLTKVRYQLQFLYRISYTVRLSDRRTVRVSDYKSNFLGATTTRLDRSSFIWSNYNLSVWLQVQLLGSDDHATGLQFVYMIELQSECLISSPTSWERRPRDWIAVRLYDRTTIRVSDYKSNFLGATTTRLDRLITLGSPSGWSRSTLFRPDDSVATRGVPGVAGVSCTSEDTLTSGVDASMALSCGNFNRCWRFQRYTPPFSASTMYDHGYAARDVTVAGSLHLSSVAVFIRTLSPCCSSINYLTPFRLL